MRAVGWLERWLVRWRLGRVRCRILVSTCLSALCCFEFVDFLLTIILQMMKRTMMIGSGWLVD
jgi:hypothetical protein